MRVLIFCLGLFISFFPSSLIAGDYTFSYTYKKSATIKKVLSVNKDIVEINGKNILESSLPDLKRDLKIVMSKYNPKNKSSKKCLQGTFKLESKKGNEHGCIGSLRFKALSKAFINIDAKSTVLKFR